VNWVHYISRCAPVNPRLLNLILGGNTGSCWVTHSRIAFCAILEGGVGRTSTMHFHNKTNNLRSLSWFEFEGEERLHRHRPPIHSVGLKLPCLHALDGGPGEDQGSLQELRILDAAIPADQDL
jgi:hypothetical protein